MAKDRAKVSPSMDAVYAQGRNARLQGCIALNCPYSYTIKRADPSVLAPSVSVASSPRLDWLAGWYDQHFGMKWEPKNRDIKGRIWPIHL